MNALQPAPIRTRTPLRAKISLFGAWDFKHDSAGVARIAQVPAPWQACFADLAVSYAVQPISASSPFRSAGWTVKSLSALTRLPSLPKFR